MHDIVPTAWAELTSRQRSIWLDITASGNDRLFQVGVCAKVSRDIDLEVLREATIDVARRHDALRLTVDTNQPRQRIESIPAAIVQLVDFSSEGEPDAAVLNYVDQLFTSPFNFGQRPLFQLIVARVEKRSNWLILRMHHIITDAIAFSLVFKDIVRTYNSLINGTKANRPRSSYLPFLKQDALYRNSPRFKRDLDYWHSRLRDLPGALFAKTSSENSATTRPLLRRQIDLARFQKFQAQCAAQKIGPANAILALSAWLLASARGRRELVLGVAYPGRTKEQQQTIGIFSGVMPLRVKVPSEISLPDLARSITQSISRDYLHYRAPIDDIRRSLAMEHRHRGTLIDAMVSYVPLDVVDFETELGDEQIKVIPLRGSEANPLAIYFAELNEAAPISLEFAFDRAYLQDHQISLLADNFERLFDAFIGHPLAAMLSVDRLVDQGTDQPTVAVDGSGDVFGKDPAFNIRIVSTFTVEPIANPLQFWLQRIGVGAALEFAGYNQVFQELLDPTGPLRGNRRGANVVLLRLQDWLRERTSARSPEESARFLEKIADDFSLALKDAVRKSHVPYVLLIGAPSLEWDSYGPRAQIQERALGKLVAELSSVPNLQIATYRELRELYPADVEYDLTSDQLGHIPYTISAFTAMATLVARRIHLAIRPPIKVIVADCDNTLWEGVVGEDGPTGVVISESHKQLQTKLVEAAKSGVLICLCSKNIEDDVTAVFHQRADMVLKQEHIVAHRINWKAKSENIRDLAKELNLGLDSFLFLDDNPLEVAEVSAACAQVLSLVVKMSSPDAMQLDHLWPLDSLSATAEDGKRVESYRSNLSRKRERETATDFSSFIRGLNLRFEIEGPNEGNLSRLAQLTERTNQFNINNIKRSGAELAKQGAAEDSAVLAFRVADKFGDYGIVGLLSARMERNELLVDTFLMSCRVLGRGVEHRMISEIGRLAIEYGASSVKIPVIVTPRNLPVRRFLEGIEGQCLTEETDQLYIISAEKAAAFSFQPGDDAEHGQDDAETPASTSQISRVGGNIWVETATALTSIPEIEKAIQSSIAGKRPASQISRSTQTQTEKVLEELFCQALALEAVGADDDFFDLGVHSLMAVQLVSRVRERFHFQMSIRALFECSTIAKLAEAIEQQRSSGYQPLVPLQQGDGRPALFCCHPANGDAVCYMRLTKAIGPDQTVYGFEASGLSPGETMARSIPEMASGYVKEMTTIQPTGPYHILGWSFGGALAFEMARQIHEAGKQVGFVGFMDAVAPEKGERPAPYRPADEPTPEDEAKLLDNIAAELNTIRRHLRLPPLTKEGERINWEQAIEGFQSIGVVPEGYSIDEMRRKMLVYGNCGLLFQQYRPPSLPVPLVHFQASQNLPEWDFDWSPYTTKGVQAIWIRCNHYRMGFEPNTTVIAAHLRALVRGEKVAVKWWRRIPFMNRVEELVGLLAPKRA